ncbi:FeoB-associated Cys-rich membrane protein [Niallia sp. NCCP-28]|uniref:FeoB-associated Cys-rich membrane protein n=1 Tax=Niallia sp. NCCP-28 TaxID=2934712 RepID=UPI0020C10B56|nr:FeoB-associated Cys-rich membrane protein [Niallia sp. NCCP-28]
MITSIILGVLIFFYASYSLFRFIQKSKQGKCASCSISKSCETKGCSTSLAGTTKNSHLIQR